MGGILRDSFRGSRSLDSFKSRSQWLGHARGASTRFMVASGGVLSEEYGPGVCLGDGQTGLEWFHMKYNP